MWLVSSVNVRDVSYVGDYRRFRSVVGVYGRSFVRGSDRDFSSRSHSLGLHNYYFAMKVMHRCWLMMAAQ